MRAAITTTTVEDTRQEMVTPTSNQLPSINTSLSISNPSLNINNQLTNIRAENIDKPNPDQRQTNIQIRATEAAWHRNRPLRTKQLDRRVTTVTDPVAMDMLSVRKNDPIPLKVSVVFVSKLRLCTLTFAHYKCGGKFFSSTCLTGLPNPLKGILIWKWFNFRFLLLSV